MYNNPSKAHNTIIIKRDINQSFDTICMNHGHEIIAIVTEQQLFQNSNDIRTTLPNKQQSRFKNKSYGSTNSRIYVAVNL